MSIIFSESRKRTLIIALALVLPFANGIRPTQAGSSENAEITAVRYAKITSVEAVARAQQHSGGNAFGMGLEVARHGTWYEIQLNVQGKAMLARIDPTRGTWLGVTEAHGEDAQGLHSLDGRKLNLSQAIIVAERASRGRTLEAGPYGQGATAHYDVDVVLSNRSVAHLRVDPDTGVVSNAPASEID